MRSGVPMSSWHGAIIPRWVAPPQHRHRSSPSPSVRRLTDALSVNHTSVDSGRTSFPGGGVTCMEQSTRRRQGRAVTALFPSPPKNIAVSQPQTITIFTFNLTSVKCPCSVFNAKCHYNLYFFNNNNNNNMTIICCLWISWTSLSAFSTQLYAYC